MTEYDKQKPRGMRYSRSGKAVCLLLSALCLLNGCATGVYCPKSAKGESDCVKMSPASAQAAYRRDETEEKTKTIEKAMEGSSSETKLALGLGLALKTDPLIPQDKTGWDYVMQGASLLSPWLMWWLRGSNESHSTGTGVTITGSNNSVLAGGNNSQFSLPTTYNLTEGSYNALPETPEVPAPEVPEQ